jgi:PHD/YefM family antitoxin component YafN of YafNO toxin-antitoxin module
MLSQPLPLMPGQALESITSTEIQNAFGKAMTRVLGGAVIGITRHEEVAAVLLSAETYRALIGALSERNVDPLAELRDRFDRRFASMQSSTAQAAAEALFEATPAALGAAAVRGARKRG